MARSERQKLKLLYIKDLLEQQSDETHPLSTQAIVDALARQGIQAERKSIYDDIACLQQYGMDIVCIRGPGGGYFLASRPFELPELKLLVDAVQSSRFLTEKKSMQLIAKLGTLASREQAGSLRRQVVVSGRVKTMNESIYYSVDLLHEAIARNSQISFRYFDWNLDGGRRYRPGKYTASPYALSLASARATTGRVANQEPRAHQTATSTRNTTAYTASAPAPEAAWVTGQTVPVNGGLHFN